MFKDAIPGTPPMRRVTRPLDFIVWFLVLLFVLTVASRSNAQNSAPQCVTLAQATEQADRAGAAIVHLTPDQAKRAAAIYDSIPPATISDAARSSGAAAMSRESASFRANSCRPYPTSSLHPPFRTTQPPGYSLLPIHFQGPGV
jgi:hypothetical protein